VNDILLSNLSRTTGISVEDLLRNRDLVRRHCAGETLTHEEFQRYLRLYDPPKTSEEP
jgi:hypothetical protein